MSRPGLVPLTKAARRCDRTPGTLRRWYYKGLLPVVKAGGCLMVPESFLLMLEASPQPGRAGDLREVAAQWFGANAPAPQSPAGVAAPPASPGRSSAQAVAS